MNRCALCPGTHKCLPPDGPREASVLFVGEAPGKDEEKKGRVFIGKTGREVDEHYLPLAGLRRSGVLFANTISCLPATAGGKLDSKRPADTALAERCAQTHLYPIIERSRTLKLIVPLGAFATRATCLDVDLEVQHGFPTQTPWGIPAFPMYHPARGIHEPKKMLEIRNDWIRLRAQLQGTLRLPIDPFPEPDYAEVTNPDEVYSLGEPEYIACDTETSRALGAYCLTYSVAPGTGRLIRAGDRRVLAAFQNLCDRTRSPLIFHNWLADASTCRDLGLSIPTHRVRDTMVLAFHLGNLPQGLKALAWREVGMLMRSFEDVVLPYSVREVLEYYRAAQTYRWPKPEEELVRDSKTGQWKMYKPQGMNTKLKRFFTDYGKNPEKDVFEMWEKNWVDEQPMLEEKLGPWPGMDIAHVPEDEALYYACRDADATGRVYQVISRMRRGLAQGLPQERWREAV